MSSEPVKVIFAIKSFQTLQRAAAEMPDAMCCGLITYNGVGLNIGFKTATQFVEQLSALESSAEEISDATHRQFGWLWGKLRLTKLASTSIPMYAATGYQTKKILKMLPSIQEKIPELQTVEDVLNFYLKYTYTLVHVQKSMVIRTDPTWVDRYGMIIYSNVDQELMSLDTSFLCANSGCHKTGERVCGECKIQKYCSEECQLDHWRKGHKHECINIQTIRHNVGSICANGACPHHGRFLCAKCRQQQYCSKDCQKQHWKLHKSTCVSCV
jgi:MYND finger